MSNRARRCCLRHHDVGGCSNGSRAVCGVSNLSTLAHQSSSNTHIEPLGVAWCGAAARAFLSSAAASWIHCSWKLMALANLQSPLNILRRIATACGKVFHTDTEHVTGLGIELDHAGWNENADRIHVTIVASCVAYPTSQFP